MALFQSNAAKGLQIPPNAHYSGVEYAQRYSYDFATTGYTANDIIEMACLPAGHNLLEVIMVTDDIDSNGAPLVAMDVGIMSGKWGENDQARTCDAVIFSGDITARTGGVARPTLRTAYRVPPAAVHRSIGVKLTALPATAAAGRLDLIVRSTPA